jgi:hypothetical protein
VTPHEDRSIPAPVTTQNTPFGPSRGWRMHSSARYSDHLQDLADASIVTAAEALATRRVFTIDRNDFAT